MLKNILKPKKSGFKKLKKDETESTNLAGVSEDMGENEETKDSASLIGQKKTKAAVKNDKLKPSSKSTIKKVPKKTMVDTMTKFINNYGETPHLQAIEDSYLKYLEA